ncbi:peptidase E [Anaerotignum propionicum]|uniref:peptidase E n=1 Tax=Anaerotignum propionicum TaxID=28446 RepID=UPI00210B0598|nr:Type 1 glutamine amidotransferase-like domain-containing protein [Anaerotignum propionicum]MCQ4936426.1 Type 1 glutamine amidotransferase-like domain-containing protein [Anaerotignum propionicum]
MKKMFLASSFKDVANIFAKFESNLEGKTVTFIPTASTVEKIKFYVNSGKKALEKLGLIVDTLDISTANGNEIKAKLTNNDFIYITGGNSFFLLQELKRTGADKVIAEEVQAGKLYIGESAGAMVMSGNIEYAKAMDSVEKAPSLMNYDALGLVDIYPVPHYESAPFKKIAQAIIDAYSPSLNLTPISNHDCILIEGSNIRIEKN